MLIAVVPTEPGNSEMMNNETSAIFNLVEGIHWRFGGFYQCSQNTL